MINGEEKVSMSSESVEVKMPKTLTIVGNGFDLAIGAKTAYEDFYDCLKDCFQAVSINDFKNAYIHDDNEELINSFYNLVKNNRDNYFINYFLNYEVAFGNWVSFEKELTKIIKSLDHLITSLNSHDKLFMDLTRHTFVTTYVRIMDRTSLLQVLSVYPDNKYFCANLRIQDFTKDGAVPFSIKGKVFKNIYEAYKGVEEFSERFPNLLYNDLITFSNLFSLYLGIVNHFVCFDKVIKDAFDTSYFINYNFTNYLEKMIELNHLKFGDVLYINGLAENVNGFPKEKIVFGIDSNTKLDNLSFEIFTKRIQRSMKDTDISHLDFVLNNSFENIFIIGHSLNVADFESLGFIFSKCEDAIKPKITIYCLNDVAKRDLIINLKTILGNNKFDEYQREGMLSFIDSNRAWIKSCK